MRRFFALPVFACALAACGDLSQEDLLFRAAVPPKEAIALRVPGADDEGGQALTQALSDCPEGDLRCDATALAAGFNGLTFGVLDIIDAVVALPPSQRDTGRRVWGPHFNFEEGRTFRFEMVREDADTFSFCLHIAEGRVTDRDVGDIDCASPDDVMTNLVSGTYQPSGIAGDGARQGEGTMIFEAEKVRRFDGGDRFADVLDIHFDNRDDATHIDIVASGVPTDNDDVVTAAGYVFDEAKDGSGALEFDVFVNLVSEGLIPQLRLEHVTLSAKWQADQSGRAVGVVDGGDLDPGETVTVDQCWNAALETIRFENVDGDVTVGEEDTVCAFAADEVGG